MAVVMARKQAVLTLKAALTAALQSALPDDCGFFERWIAQADDPVFERLGADIMAHGEVDGDLRVIYGVLVSLARSARWTAQDVKTGIDPMQQRAQRERDGLLKLADKADDLAKFCRGSGLTGLAYLMSPQVALDSLLRERDVMSLQQLGELHEREAKLLRQLASQDLQRTPTRISRERPRRETGAFMYLMVQHMRESSGNPHYDAVADMTNIAFPKADATADRVRAACRPTTRSGRYRLSRMGAFSIALLDGRRLVLRRRNTRDDNMPLAREAYLK
jgi:hypothetical protein